MDKTWKQIPGFEHRYECSACGCIRSRADFHGGESAEWHELKSRPTPRGYPVVCLQDNGKRQWMTVHRIVWRTFRGEIPKKFTINHINGVKADNRIENLEAVSHSENVKHAFRSLGRKPCVNGLRGEKQASAKLTDALVREIRSKFTGRNRSALAREYGLDKSTVGRVISRQTWSHVD